MDLAVHPKAMCRAHTICPGLVAKDPAVQKKAMAVTLFHYTDGIILTSNSFSELKEASETMVSYLKGLEWGNSCDKLARSLLQVNS